MDYLVNTIKLMFALTPKIPPPINAVLQDDVTRLTWIYFASLVPSENNAHRSHKRCRVCYARKKFTKSGNALKTSYICTDCTSVPGLHPGECFRAYHTKLDYSVV